MLTSIIIAAIAFSGSGSSPLSGGEFRCVSTGQAYSTPSELIDFNGIEYGTCCGGCAAQFEQGPVHMLANDAAKNWLVGVSLFDFVSGERIPETKSKFHDDYKGVRYLFTSKANLDTFKSDPAKYTETPEKQLLQCPVRHVDIASESKAAGFVDYKGTRYYVCCSDCLPLLKADPAKYITASVASKAISASPENIKG